MKHHEPQTGTLEMAKVASPQTKSPAERGFLRRCTVGRLELVANGDAIGGRVEVSWHGLSCGEVSRRAQLGLAVEHVDKPLVIQSQRGADLWCQDELGIHRKGSRRTPGIGGLRQVVTRSEEHT